MTNPLKKQPKKQNLEEIKPDKQRSLSAAMVISQSLVIDRTISKKMYIVQFI